MFEGKCPKCGSHYWGWALTKPQHKFCSKCGSCLAITEGGQALGGYGPSLAQESVINAPAMSFPSLESDNNR